MGSSRIRSFVWFASVVAVVWACGGTSADPGPAGDAASAFSFPQGDNLGFCASNPSPECDHGTPLAPKQLVFTFDDGPGSQTKAFADWLASQGIPATFFVLGEYVSDASVLAREKADGHLVGNHTWDHQDLTTLSDAQIVSEVSRDDAVIAPYVAGSHFVFRAPYGAWSSHDYDVLQNSSMNEYVGPVRWDIGGQMTSAYAADWDCWQNQSGYGVMTSKQCGDRYLKQIADVGRGIVLMHDQDYGDVTNHDITSGQGNTIDMVKYMVPILKSQGYTFVRVDQVPDIAAQFGGGGGTCAFNPTWQQRTANEWWIEYAITGTITAASLEVVGGATTTLSSQWGKWVGGPSQRIPTGTSVIVHATNSSNQSAKTKAFPYLVTTNPVTDCSGGTDGGVPDAGGADAGADAGGADAGDGGGCSPLNPKWSQGNANTWWVEYAISAPQTIASAYLEVVGGQTVQLSSMWGKWVGGPSQQIPAGTKVIVHAKDTSGDLAQTSPFGYLQVTSPATAPCP